MGNISFFAGLNVRLLFMALFLIAMGTKAHSSPEHEPEWDPRLVQGQLANGLTYYIYDSEKPTDPYNIRLIVRAGSVDEEQPSGIAHIIEHMVFQSTASHPETVHRHLDQIGWRTGREINAMTRETETQFMIRTRPHDRIGADAALALLADMVLHPSFKEADWQKERLVILEELRRGEGAADRINRQKKAVLRAGSRYVDRPTIGTREGIMAASMDAMRDFHDHFYTASNMVLIVSGQVEAQAVRSAIEQSFGRAEARPKPDRSYVAFPLRNELSGGVVQDEKGSTSQVTYAFRLPMPDRATSEGSKAYLEKYLLDRLIRQKIERLATAYADKLDGLSFVMQEPTENRLILALNGKTRDHQNAAALLLEVAERLRREGIAQTDFEAVMADARAINARNPEAAQTRTYAEWEDRIASAVLTQGIVSDPQRRTERTVELLDQISLQTVNDRLAWMLGAADQVMLYQFPGQQLAVAPDLAVLLAQRERLAQLTQLPPLPVSEKPQSVLLPAIPDWPQGGAALPSGKVVGVEQEPHSTVTEWRLSNGDRFVWLDHQTPAAKIYLSGRSSVGYRNQQFGSILSQAALQLWTQSGFGFWSQAQYDRWQEKQTQTWSWALHAGHLDVGAVVDSQHLPDLMRNYAATIEHGLVRDAAVPAFAKTRADLGAGTDVFGDLVYGPGPDEQDDTQAVTRERLEAAAQALLRQPVTWFAVGPKPDDAALDKVFAMAGGLDRRSVLTASAHQQRSGTKWQILHTGGDDRAQVRITFSSRHNWTPEAGFILSTFNQPTQQALKAELRHRLSGVYSVKFDLNLDKDTNRVVGELSFSCAPERANELSHAAIETLKRMPDIIRDVDVAILRKDIAYAEQQRQTDPATLLRRLALSYQRYGDASYLRRVQALGDKLTADRMSRHARHVFDLTNLVVLIETPEKWVP